MVQVNEQQNFARELALSLGAVEHHLLLVDEYAKDCIEKAGSEEMRDTYSNILAASERAKEYLYSVRDDIRTAMRANKLEMVAGYRHDH